VGLIGGLDARDLADAVVNLALRVSYVEYLAKVLEYVPDARPHEDGALWAEVIYHVLTPRIIFPEKGALFSDSERTMLYTGEQLASDAEGTSVSIGYVGDSYVDFGITGALAIPFMLGVLYALMGHQIIAASDKGDIAVVTAVLVVLLSPVQQFEIGSIKLFPGLLWAWIVGTFVIWIVWPRVRPLFCVRRGASASNKARGLQGL